MTLRGLGILGQLACKSLQVLEPTLSSSVPTQGGGHGLPSTEGRDLLCSSPVHDLCNSSLAGFLATGEGDKGCQGSK